MARNKSYREPEDSFNEMGVPALNSRIAADAAISGEQSFNEAVMNAYQNVKDGIADDLKRKEEERLREEERKEDPVRYQMSSAHQSYMTDFDSLLNGLESRAEEYRKEHEAYQKGARSRALISGIGDSISSLANLIGVGNWASNQKQEYQAPKVAADAERERKEHHIRMDGIRDRMDRLKANESKARLAMSMGLAEYDAKRRAEMEAASAAAAKAQQEQDRWEAQERSKENRFNAEMQFNRDQAANKAEQDRQDRELQRERYEREEEGRNRRHQAEMDLRRDLASGKGRTGGATGAGSGSRGKSDDYFKFSYYDKNGETRTLEIDKESLAESGRRNYQVLRDDIASSYGFADYNDYLNRSKDRKDDIMKTLSDSAKSELKELSEDFSTEEINRIVDKYGTRSPNFMGLLESSASNVTKKNAQEKKEAKSNFDDIF